MFNQSRIRILAALLTTLFLASACMTTKKGTVEGNFTVDAILERALPSEIDIKVKIDSTSINGEGPVNRWFGGVFDNQINKLGTTRMAGPPMQMRIEAELLRALEGSELVVVDPDTVVAVKGGAVVVVLTRR